MEEMGSAILGHLARKSPIGAKIQAANLVASLAEHNPDVKEYNLITENVMWRLVTLLSSEQSTMELKISCSKALWMLARGSVSNCRTITETKGMLCLVELVKTEQDELQYICLMIIREITDIAESNHDYRHSTFKSSSLATKAVVDELLRVIKEFDDTKMRIPAIKSIGSLASSFSATESTRVISPLVAELENTNQQVSVEAAIALQKFVCKENPLCSEHSNSIIEFNGVPVLIKLLHGDEKSQLHGFVLVCYLAKHSNDSYCSVLIKTGILAALEPTGHKIIAEYPVLEELVSDAIYRLQPNLTDKHSEIETHLRDLIFLADRVQLKVCQAQSFRVNCRETGDRIYRLSEMLQTLLSLITLDPILFCLNSIHRLLSVISKVVQEALTIACKYKPKTPTKGVNHFHKLNNDLRTCIINMKWLLIYNPKFNSSFTEISLSLPEILTEDSSIPLAWNGMVIGDKIRKLARFLTGDDLGTIVLNNGKIKGFERLLGCLAKLLGTQNGELQCNCLMIIMEITAAAESNLDHRCKLFKSNLPGVKAIIDQLLKIVKKRGDSALQLLAIRSIGYLAKIFSESKNHVVINVLVMQLENEHQQVVFEAVRALQKFVCEENHVRQAHSKRMIEFNAVKPLVELLKDDGADGDQRRKQLHVHALVLMCHLAVNADYNEAMEEARVVTVFQQLLATTRGQRRTVVSEHAELKLLVDRALPYLTLYYKY